MLAGLLSGFLSATIGYSATFVAQLHGGGKPRAACRAFAQGLWLTMPLDLGLTAVLFVCRWRSRKWQNIRLDG